MQRTYLKLSLLAVLVAGATMIISCEKESDENKMLASSYTKSMNIPIPNYSSYEEVNEIIQKAISFDTLSELLEYERTQGRKSIGAISDKFYENIDKEKFSSQDEVLEFCNENFLVLDTFVKNDEIHITPKYSQNSFRYVANQDGLFIIKDCVIRLFKNSMISTHESNLNKLLSIKEADIESLDTLEFKVSKKIEIDKIIHNSCYYSNVCGGTLYDGTTKFEMELYLFFFYPFYSSTPINYTKLEVSNYNKFMGIWWSERYTTIIDGTVTIHKKNSETDTWESITKSINVNEKIRSKDFTIYKDKNTERIHTLGLYYHFKSFNIKGRNPRLDYLTLQWN